LRLLRLGIGFSTSTNLAFGQRRQAITLAAEELFDGFGIRRIPDSTVQIPNTWNFHTFIASGSLPFEHYP
jgi:hypothetical protein